MRLAPNIVTVREGIAQELRKHGKSPEVIEALIAKIEREYDQPEFLDTPMRPQMEQALRIIVQVMTSKRAQVN